MKKKPKFRLKKVQKFRAHFINCEYYYIYTYIYTFVLLSISQICKFQTWEETKQTFIKQIPQSTKLISDSESGVTSEATEQKCTFRSVGIPNLQSELQNQNSGSQHPNWR